VATHLIELLTKEFGGENLGELAGLLGEPESKVQAAVGGVVPAQVASAVRAAAILKTAPKDTVIEIGGHTDNTGDPAANQKLSEDRANDVRSALVAAGADGAVLVAKGYGDTRPVASNDTEYGKFRNRRIEYSIPAAPAK